MTGKEWYAKQLQSPKWKAKRLEILSRDNFTCTRWHPDPPDQPEYDPDCDPDYRPNDGLDYKPILHVHHLSYSTGKMPWEYDNSNFITVCAGCHEQIHYEARIAAAHKKMADHWLILGLPPHPKDNMSSVELCDFYTKVIKSHPDQFVRYLSESTWEWMS